jgi:rhodanese-related sulfurtransferase
MQKIISEWPKDQERIFICHHGMRSLGAASFFCGSRFSTCSVDDGGIDAWSIEVDSDLRRYHLEQ